MARETTPLYLDDLSGFAKSLRKSLTDLPEPPSHSAFLSLLAKAAGYRNYQHLKASQDNRRSGPEPWHAPARSPQLDKALRAFDSRGVLARWPAQTAVQGLCLWVFWARLPAKKELSEGEVNAVLKAGNSFGDHVLLRRSLIDHGLVTRSRDGRVYTRIEQRPPDVARALLTALPG